MQCTKCMSAINAIIAMHSILYITYLPYIQRNTTANMSWRMCVVIKQMESNLNKPRNTWNMQLTHAVFHLVVMEYRSVFTHILQEVNSLRPSDTHWRHMATKIYVNIGSVNGLLPDGTKPLPPGTNVDLSSVRFCGIHMRTISQEIPQPSITKISLKSAYLKFH